MRLTFDSPHLIAKWAALHIPTMKDDPDFGPCSAIGVLDANETPVAAVVFNNYHPSWGTIEISCAATSARWLTKRLITGILSYPFGQLGCQRVQASTPLSATSARQFLKKLGFTLEGVGRSAMGAGVDVEVWSLLADEWAVSRFNVGRVVRGKEVSDPPRRSRSRRSRERARSREHRDRARAAEIEHGEQLRP